MNAGARRLGRGLQGIKAEVTQQCVDHLCIFGGRVGHTEPGVVMHGVYILMAPQAGSREVYRLYLALRPRDLQAQLELHVDHHGQLADQHQPLRGDIAQIANGLVRQAIEHLKETR